MESVTTPLMARCSVITQWVGEGAGCSWMCKVVLQTDPSVKLYNHGEGPY